MNKTEFNLMNKMQEIGESISDFKWPISNKNVRRSTGHFHRNASSAGQTTFSCADMRGLKTTKLLIQKTTHLFPNPPD